MYTFENALFEVIQFGTYRKFDSHYIQTAAKNYFCKTANATKMKFRKKHKGRSLHAKTSHSA